MTGNGLPPLPEWETDAERGRCRGCVWAARGRGGATCSARYGAPIRLDWPACGQQVDVLDCADCGACCREAYHAVEFGPRDPFLRRHPEVLIVEEGRTILPRPGGRCVCLEGEAGSFRCALYADRPRTCRDFTAGSRNCHEARKRVGLQPR